MKKRRAVSFTEYEKSLLRNEGFSPDKCGLSVEATPPFTETPFKLTVRKDSSSYYVDILLHSLEDGIGSKLRTLAIHYGLQEESKSILYNEDEYHTSIGIIKHMMDYDVNKIRKPSLYPCVMVFVPSFEEHGKDVADAVYVYNSDLK